MTLLGYITRKLLGPPITSDYWTCPFCDSSHASFTVRPPKSEGQEPKFKCYRCSAWGDAHDLLKLLKPGLNFAQRCDLIDQYKEEFDDAVAADASSIHPRGIGRVETIDKRREEQAVAAGFAELAGTEIDALALAARIEYRVKTKPSPLAEYCLGFNTWVDLMERARPMMEEQVAEEERERQEQIERVRRSMGNGPIVNAKSVQRNGKAHR